MKSIAISKILGIEIVLVLALVFLFSGATSAQAALDVLVVGSTHSFSEGGEDGVLHEKPFNPAGIASQLQNILAADAAISEPVNVVFEDIYTNKNISLYYDSATFETHNRRCYSLAQYYMWPEGMASRRANLRGESTPWDYVIIMADPYVIANFPGMFAEGANMLINEIRSGTAEPMLFAQWPENISSNTAAYFNEIVYRIGDSANVRVVPGGKAWDSYTSQDSSASHPTPDGAYLAAASIYSELYDRSAKTSGYTYSSVPKTTALADHALSNIQTNVGVAQYSGAFTNITPFSMKFVPKRLVSYNWTGSSTEWHTEWALLRLDDRVGITFTRAYNAPPIIDFNMGRGNDRFEDEKDYEVNPAKFDRSYGLPMHDYYKAYASNTMPYGIDKQYNGGVTYDDGTDLGIAYNMIRPGTRETSLPADVRCIPLRLMFTKMHEQAPTMNPLADDTHMNYNLDDASAAFIYTLLSGRCPLVAEPSPVNETMSSDWMRWLGNKIGYETAWRMGRITTRVPGFQVLPTSATASNVAPTNAETLSVRFWYAPTSDVTVAVSSDNLFRGKATPSTLTFTPANYSNAQTVTVIGQTGSAGTYEFNVTLATTSADPIYDGLSDSWNFFNIRPEGPLPSDIRVLANNKLIWSGDMDPIISDASHYGVLSGPGSRTFTITNISQLATVNLTNSPKVTVTDPAGVFALTQDAALGSLVPGGAATTFNISCTPPSPGLHTALVSIASTDWAVPDYRFAIAAIFADAPPSAVTQAAVSSGPTNATLGGVLTDGGGAEAWICWGDNDGGTSSTSGWDHVLYMGTIYEGASFSTNISGLFYGIQYEQRVFVSNYAGTAWSSLKTFSSAYPSPAVSVTNTGVDLITTTTADLHGRFGGTNSIFTVSVYWSENNNAGSAAWLADGSASNIVLGTFTNVFNYALQHTATGLTPGTTYYYAFRINNELTNLWANPNGSFVSASAPTVDNAGGASTEFKNSATLRGVLTAGSGANAWICWGDNDAGTDSTNGWDNVISIGPVLQGAVFSQKVTGLGTNMSYWYRSFVANGAGVDWSDTAEVFSGTPASVSRSATVVPGWDYSAWTGDENSGIDNEFTYTAAHNFGNRRAGITVNGVYFPEAVTNSGVNWTVGTSGSLISQTATITGDSVILSEQAIYNVNPRVITFMGLTPGTTYEASLFSVGWENGTRDLPCSAVGGPSTNINQDAYGNDQGIRITYTYEAASSSQVVSVASSGFHLYALANREVPPTLPMINIAPASVSNHEAALCGTLNAEGAEFDVYAYWGTANGGTNAAAWGSGDYVGSWTNVITNVQHVANNLVAGQPQYYTFLASNASTVAWATPSWQFITPQDADPNLPAINSSIGAAGVTATNALLIGTLTSTGGAATTVTCYWNANSDPGASTAGWAHSISFGVASGPRNYTNDTSGTAALLQGTTYYYRYRAVNSYGTNWSSVASFATLMPPTVENATGAVPLSYTSAALVGELTEGVSASAWICWGAMDGGTASTGDWEHVVPVGAVAEGVAFSNVVSSLETNVTYWYRCRAVNGAGEDWSDNAMTFSGTPAGGSGGTWSPINLTNIVAWFDAADTSTVLRAGSSVTNWLDKSGHGNHATQTVSANQPEVGAFTQNGLQLITVRNGDKNMSVANSPAMLMGIAMVNIRSTGTSAILNIGSYSASSHEFFVRGSSPQLSFDGSGTTQGKYTKDGAGFSVFAEDHTVTSTGPHIWGGVFASTNALKTIINRPALVSDSTGHDVGEIMWFSSELSSNDLQKCEGYLAHKWGLEANLPAQHPYRNDHPGGGSSAIANLSPSTITATGAVMNASLDASGTNYDVYVYYGTSDGGTNAGSWTTSARVGSYTNVSTNVSFTANLSAAETNYYTFMASNSTTVVWASPSWQFITPGEPAPTFNLTVTTAHGTAVPNGLTTPASNSLVNAAIIDSPVLNGNTQYVCTGWVAAGSAPASGSTTNMSFMITNDTTITWLWDTNIVTAYTVIFNEGANGSRTGGGALTQSVVEGMSAAVPTITPDAGYAFNGWDSSAYTNVTSNMTINAQYSIINYTLVYLAGANGSISGTQTQTVSYGNTGSAVTAVPASGYHFVNWSDAGTSNPRTDTGVTGNINVTANFAIDTPPVVNNSTGAVSVTETSAQLSGVLINGVDATAWICWGLSDGGTSSTGDWDNVVSIGAVSQGVTFSTNVTGLSTNTTYFYRCYATNAYGFDWSDMAISFSGTPASSAPTGPGGSESVTIGQWDFEGAGGRGGGVLLPPWRKALNGGNAIAIESYATLGTKVDVPPGGGAYCHYNNGSDHIYQVLSTNLAAKTTYTLSAVAIDRTDYAFPSCQLRLGYVPGTDDGSTGSDAIANHFYGDYLLSATVLTNTAPVNGTAADDGYVKWSSQFTTGDSPAGEGYPIRIEILGSAVQSLFDNVTLTKTSVGGGGSVIATLAPTAISSTTATLNASLNASGTNYDIYVYCGTNDGGTNASSWAETNAVGSFTNVSTTVSYISSNLTAGQTYCYTFMASNTAGVAWASPSWRFATPGVQPATVTTNYLVPYQWLTIVLGVTSNYEQAVTNDTDGDGFADWEEYWAGTDPTTNASFLHIASIEISSTNYRLIWAHSMITDHAPEVAIQGRGSMLAGSWSNVAVRTGTNGINFWTAPGQQAAFYRLCVTNVIE